MNILRFPQQKKEAPNIKVGRTREGTIFELVTAVLVIVMWVIAFIMWRRSPEVIPTHFNLSGHPDGYGSRSMLLILPIVGTIVSAVLLLCAYQPAKINMPVRMNTTQQYVLAIRMVRIVAIITTLMFISIILMSSSAGSKWAFACPVATFAALIAVIVFFTIKVAKAKRS